MTNSSNVIRTRRAAPPKALFIFGALVIVAVTIPFAVQHMGSVQFPDLSKLVPSKNVEADKKATPAKLNSRFAVTATGSASYVQALDQAVAQLSAEIQRRPSDPSLQNRLGLLYLTLGDSKSAEQCFQNAVTLSRGAISAHASNVERFKGQGKMSDASKQVLEASQASVELSAAHSNLARVYDQRGDRKAVIAELDQINKDGALFSTGFGTGTSRGKLSSNDNNLTAQDTQMLAQAESLFKANQLGPALQTYRRLAESNPRLAFVQDRIGLISVMTGDVNSGIDAWEKAAKLNPSSASIQANLGLAYHQISMDKESESSFRKALSLNPALEEAALNLGELLSAKGDFKGAIAVMSNATKSCPNSARAANNLGTMLSMNGNYSEAISAFHKAIRIDPGMSSAHYGIGMALMKMHNYAAAIPELKIALALNGKLIDAQNKIEEAQKALSRH